MNKINNPLVALLMIIVSMLTLDYLYKNPVNNTDSGRNGDMFFKETVETDQSPEKENWGSNAFTSPQPFSENEVQFYENIENEGINIKFDLGIIL